jgi:hypothetical protein
MEYFYCVDRVHGFPLHGGRCAACRDSNTNFAYETACLTTDNIRRNEVVEIQEITGGAENAVLSTCR